jgi:hypothetical protein
VAVVLAACQGERAAPDVDAALRTFAPAPRAAPAAEPAARHEPQLCTVLANVVASEPAGFAQLHGRPLATRQGLGRALLPGTERCTIEGVAWPQANYSCTGAPLVGDGGDDAQGAFAALAADLDQCLDSPIWFPRTWRRGSAFVFALGERLQAWIDHSTPLPSQIVLKVQKETSSRVYRVQLDVQAAP